MKRRVVVAFLFFALPVCAPAHCVSSFAICFFGFLQENDASSGGKTAPMAKTQEELDAFVAATGQSDINAAETAVADFAAKFPESELRASAYAQVMQRYQQGGNSEKTIAMGRKALALDPQHTVALVVTATTLADSTSETSADAKARLDEAIKDADDAIQTLQKNRFVGPDVSPEQLETIKRTLLGTAHAARGMAMKTKKDYAGAETAFKAAVSSYSPKQEPSALLHLAITQDYLNKHAEALGNVNAAVAAADAQKKPELAAAARKQQARLKTLLANARTKSKRR
jgi:tetratricopeptide (TPR) repeat protein